MMRPTTEESMNNESYKKEVISGDRWGMMAPPPVRRPVANAAVASKPNNSIIHNHDSIRLPSVYDNRSSTPNNNLPYHQYHRSPPPASSNRLELQQQRNDQYDHHSNSNNNLKRRHSPPSNHRHHQYHRHDSSYYYQRNNSSLNHHHHDDSNKRHRSGDTINKEVICGDFNQSKLYPQPPPCSGISSSSTGMITHRSAAAALVVASAASLPPPPGRLGMATQEVQSSLSIVNLHVKSQENKKNGQLAASVVDLTGNDDDDDNHQKKPPAIVNNNINNNNNLVAAAVNNNSGGTTHILFVLDFSSSMLKKDVKTNQQQKGGKLKCITRWDAVFECIRSFLAEQLSTLNNVDDDENGVIDVDKIYENNNKNATMMVSVVIFNDTAQTLLERMPLVHDGTKVLAAVNTAQKIHKPKGGTGFSAGFERAKLLTLASSKKSNNNNNNNNALDQRNNNINNDNVVLVFLSDGRPGDLQQEPPSDSRMPMQLAFKSKKQTYPAAGVHIEDMQRAYGDRFNLQLVCLYPEGRNWLRYLAERYKGTFHEPDLTLDNEIPSAAAPAAVQRQAFVAAVNKGNAHSNDDEDDDGVLEVIVKSQNTVLREKFNRALAAGNVHTVASTTMAASQTTSSMRSTFQSISSTVTAMRNGCSSSRLSERKVVLADDSPMISYYATRMVLDTDHGKILLAPGEQPDGRLVSVSMKPFAQGGLRNVYRMQQAGERRQVAKESRHDIKYQERLKFHIESAKCMAKAKMYAKKFNKRVAEQKMASNNNNNNSHHHPLAAVPPIAFLSAEVYRLKDLKYPGGFRYLAVEKFVTGKYEKWNSNNGFVNNNTACTQCLVAQAFSHFSYEYSKKDELVVDIQGSGFEFTDPQLHSKEKQFGRADRGASGFQDFFRTHQCNYICQELGLKNRSMNHTS